MRYGYGDTRLPSTVTTLTPGELKSGDECEVLNDGRTDDEPSGWWPATVKMMKGEFFVVDYSSLPVDETHKSDIVPSDRIRPPNRKYIILIFRFLSNLIFI